MVAAIIAAINQRVDDEGLGAVVLAKLERHVTVHFLMERRRDLNLLAVDNLVGAKVAVLAAADSCTQSDGGSGHGHGLGTREMDLDLAGGGVR